jgi:hypothetical protein
MSHNILVLIIMTFYSIVGWAVTALIFYILIRIVYFFARLIGVFQGRGNVAYSYDKETGKVRQHKMKL